MAWIRNTLTLQVRHLVTYVVFIFFLSALVANAYARGKHAVTLDDLLSVKEGDYPQQLSPNGDMLVYSREGSIWLVETKLSSTPRKLIKGYLPVWSPDGKRFAYYSEETSTFQLWVFDIATNRPEQVTHLAGGIDPAILQSMVISYGVH